MKGFQKQAGHTRDFDPTTWRTPLISLKPAPPIQARQTLNELSRRQDAILSILSEKSHYIPSNRSLGIIQAKSGQETITPLLSPVLRS